MTIDSELKQGIELIDRLSQNQLYLIEARLRDLDQPYNPQLAFEKVKSALRELYETITLNKALLRMVTQERQPEKTLAARAR